MKNILIIGFIMLLFSINSSVSAQKEDKKIDYGISLAVTPWSWYYNDRNGDSYDFWKGVSWYPVLDFVGSFETDKRYHFAINLSNMVKESFSKGGISYKFDYISFSPVIGLKFNNSTSLNLGPYWGYIYNVKKGGIEINNDDLKKLEYGIELMYLFKKKQKMKFSPFGFQVIKFQLGLNEILFFKTMSFSLSLLGYYF